MCATIKGNTNFCVSFTESRNFHALHFFAAKTERQKDRKTGRQRQKTRNKDCDKETWRREIERKRQIQRDRKRGREGQRKRETEGRRKRKNEKALHENETTIFI
jgi:hypothetical protein